MSSSESFSETEHVADRHAAFSGGRKCERTGHHVAVVVEHRPLDFNGHRLAVQLLQRRFRIKGIEMRDTTGHEAEYPRKCWTLFG